MKNVYGLTGLPFKRRVPVNVQLEAFVNQVEAQKEWKSVLKDAKKTPDSNFISLIVGDYGSGKSLSLLRINEDAKNTKGCVSFFLTLFSEQRPSKPSLEFILRVFKTINFDLFTLNEKQANELKSYNEEVGEIYNAIINSKDKEIQKLAKYYLTGEINPAKSDLIKLNVIRKINHVDIAKEYLIGLLYIVKENGYKTLVLSIDEFEYLFSIVSQSRQSELLALLRGLFDIFIQIPEFYNKISNMALFLGISDDGLTRLNQLSDIEIGTGGPIQPLMGRITKIIGLSPLDFDSTNELILKRLSLNRTDDTYNSDPLIPFDKSFVEVIFSSTAGKPREIIYRCDHVLDMGIEKQVQILTGDFAKEVFKERGIPF